MKTILENSIKNLKKCYTAPDKLVKSLLNDDLAFGVAMTVVSDSIKRGVITKEDFLKQIKEV